MIFEALAEAAGRGELLLIDGGVCRWHLRRDGVLVVREIVATRKGAGSEMLARLVAVAREHGAPTIRARCPADLPANRWYPRRGFGRTGTETARSGRVIDVWELDLPSSTAPAATRPSAGSPGMPGG